MEKADILREIEKKEVGRQNALNEASKYYQNINEYKSNSHDYKLAYKGLFAIGHVLNIKLKTWNKTASTDKQVMDDCENLLEVFSSINSMPIGQFDLSKGIDVFEIWLKKLRDELEKKLDQTTTLSFENKQLREKLVDIIRSNVDKPVKQNDNSLSSNRIIKTPQANNSKIEDSLSGSERFVNARRIDANHSNMTTELLFNLETSMLLLLKSMRAFGLTLES